MNSMIILSKENKNINFQWNQRWTTHFYRNVTKGFSVSNIINNELTHQKLRFLFPI
jgi:hypothetical protein